MKLNGNNIITDNDITLTGKHSGETLDVILDNQQEEIDKLKGNVKWIYQNGGVGGNGSSGGGVTGAWSIFATLESTQVKSNNIILNGNGNYNLVVKINKPQGQRNIDSMRSQLVLIVSSICLKLALRWRGLTRKMKPNCSR